MWGFFGCVFIVLNPLPADLTAQAQQDKQWKDPATLPVHILVLTRRVLDAVAHNPDSSCSFSKCFHFKKTKTPLFINHLESSLALNYVTAAVWAVWPKRPGPVSTQPSNFWVWVSTVLIATLWVIKGIAKVGTELGLLWGEKGEGAGETRKRKYLLPCERRKQIFQHAQELKLSAASSAATFW